MVPSPSPLPPTLLSLGSLRVRLDFSEGENQDVPRGTFPDPERAVGGEGKTLRRFQRQKASGGQTWRGLLRAKPCSVCEKYGGDSLTLHDLDARIKRNEAYGAVARLYGISYLALYQHVRRGHFDRRLSLHQAGSRATDELLRAAGIRG